MKDNELLFDRKSHVLYIFLPIVGGLFRQLRLSHKGKAQNIGVGTHAANGIGQDGGRDVQQTVIIIIWF